MDGFKAASTAALGKMATAYKPNATFRDKLTGKDYAQFPIFKALALMIELEATMHISGPPGTGKSSTAEQFLDLYEYKGNSFRTLRWNFAMEDIDMHALQFPGSAAWDSQLRVLKTVLAAQYRPDPAGRKSILLADDFNRTLDYLLNVAMQLMDKHELLGEYLDLHGMLLVSNPSGGDEDVASLDFTQADRSFTVLLGRDDTPWSYGLAAKFPSIDLSDVFRIVRSLPGDARDILNARSLDHLIQVLLAGLPGILALPVSGPQGFMVRHKLVDGGDVTDRVISDIARSIGAPNPDPAHVYDLYGKVVDFSVEKGLNALIYGEPGVGKTEATMERVRDMGFRSQNDCGPEEYPTVFAISAPGLSREYFSGPFPAADRGSIDQIVSERFAIPEPFVWILDEATRQPSEVKPAVQTLSYDRRVGNMSTNMRCMIALANPPLTVDGMPLSVGEPFDLAQATRYAVSLYVGPESIDWKRHLRGKYGEEYASMFIEWWEEDLDETTRPKVTPRCLERMMRLVKLDADPQVALPMIDSEQVMVPLALLKSRMEKREVPRLRRIVAEADRYADEMAKGHWAADEKGRNLFIPDDPEVHKKVAEAFRQADLDQLEANRDVLLRLFPLLAGQHHERFIKASNLQQFWVKILLEGSKDRTN